MPQSSPSPVPTIRRALEEFANERQGTLPAHQSRLVRRILLFLALCINNYGHRNLDEEERDELERHFHAPGEAQRHFFDVFGPEKLLAELDFFHGSYLKTEVQTTEKVEGEAPSVIADLRQWLVDKGYLDSAALTAEEARAKRRPSTMRRAAKARRALAALLVGDAHPVRGDGSVPWDHHLITRIEPGKVWLRVYRGPKAECIGPMEVPMEVSESLEVGWSICAALRRDGLRWNFAEVSEIYPRL
jgi:hypothetical protein